METKGRGGGDLGTATLNTVQNNIMFIFKVEAHQEYIVAQDTPYKALFWL